MVCARYDVGPVVRADALAAGSAGSPKVVLTVEDGRRYLLKRRGPGRNDPGLVRFTHELQRRLAEHAYPLAPLCATRDGRTMLTVGGHTYELFAFVEGRAYDRTTGPTRDAGRGLGFFHRILAKHLPSQRPARESYHDAPWVRGALGAIDHGGLAPFARVLAPLYERCAEHASRCGVAEWPVQIIHADWHPGNMLFSRGRVAAVLDYDSARIGPRAVDVANGALQFSLTTRGPDPADWPESADLRRLEAFCRGYESVPECVISRAEIEALSSLMVEAIIAEAVGPVARDGRFGPFGAGAFLGAIARKADWIDRNRDRIGARVDA